MSEPVPTELRQDGTIAPEERHAPVGSRPALHAYVAAVLAFPVLLILSSLLWMTTAEYQRHAQYPSFVGLGYGSRLRGVNCDVVVDGDSSALTGVVPAVIEQRTGLKTCNIADVAGVKYVTGLAVLDDYLSKNRRPRFLIFVLVPENLSDPRTWGEVAHFEGWFYALRYHRDRALLHRILSTPEDFMISAELGLRTGLQWLPYSQLPPALHEARERAAGRLAEPGPPPSECAPPLRRRSPDPAWLAGLRRRYSAPGTTVLIDVTPEPACDPSFSFYAARTGSGVTDNGLGALPFKDYTDTGRLHTNDVGAAVFSERIAAQIAGQIVDQVAASQHTATDAEQRTTLGAH